MASQTFMFFLKLCNLKQLLTLQLRFKYTNENEVYSLFHMRVLKCRELIFNETNLLATPANFPGPYITAIIDKSMFDKPDFGQFLSNKELDIITFEETTPSILQECLQYTCTAKLSPAWNLVGNILVQGSEFLTSNNPINAVKMDIFATINEISLCLKPTCVRMPPLKMEMHEKPEILELSKFIRMNEICHVLPSFKRGKIVSATKNLGNQRIFKTYKQLQKHWKYMYGYLLPDIEGKDIWYLNVSFFNSTSYTYPEFCVKPYEMILVPRVDPRKSLCCFVKDFCKMTGNICGEKCKIIEYKASFPFLNIYPANEITENIRPRPGTTYTMKSEVAYRKVESMINKPNLKISDSKENNSNSIDNKCTDSLVMIPQINASVNDQSNVSNHISNLLSTVSINKAEKTSTKYAPCFQSKKPQKKLLQLKITQSSSQGTKYAPDFFPVKKHACKISISSQNRKIVYKETLSKEMTVRRIGKETSIKKKDYKKKKQIS